MMNAIQEAELHQSIYHYFLWRQHAQACSTTKNNNNNNDNNKYQMLAGVMAQLFPHYLTPPQHSSSPPPERMQQPQQQQQQQPTTIMPHMIRTLYVDYPALQREVYASRSRIAQLEALLQAAHETKQQQQYDEFRKTLDPTSPLLRNAFSIEQRGFLSPVSTTTTPGSSRKRARTTSTDASSTTKPDRSVTTIRPNEDVPKQSKLSVTTSHQEKRIEQRKIERLQARCDKEKAKNIALEKTILQLQANTTESVRRTPPPQQKKKISALSSANENHQDWKKDVTFEDRYRELLHFQKGNGHTRVPLRQPGLGRWVGDVRSSYKAIRTNAEWADSAQQFLTDERIAKLNQIGFEWNVSKPTVPWEERFQELMVFKEKNGHCNIPRGYKDNPSLGEWVHMQRKLFRRKSKIIIGERARKLEEAGFQWNSGIPPRPTFEDRLEECRAFRRQHGHLNIPPPVLRREEQTTYESKEEKSFRLWAQRQRDDYRKFHDGMKTSLDRTRIRKLDEMGFCWDFECFAVDGKNNKSKTKNEEIYDKRIEELRRIKEQFGDCNDLKILKAAGHPEKSSLYGWMKAQRKAWKALKRGEISSLTADRIAKLESLGFNFEPRKHYAPYGSQKAARAAGKAGVNISKVHHGNEEEDDDDFSSTAEEEEDERGHCFPSSYHPAVQVPTYEYFKT